MSNSSKPSTISSSLEPSTSRTFTPSQQRAESEPSTTPRKPDQRLSWTTTGSPMMTTSSTLTRRMRRKLNTSRHLLSTSGPIPSAPPSPVSPSSPSSEPSLSSLPPSNLFLLLPSRQPTPSNPLPPTLTISLRQVVKLLLPHRLRRLGR
jgi:hypothetical protein